jgi:hypothetical protein
MAWRPSDDETLQRPARNKLWDSIETLFDNRVSTTSLPRHKWEELSVSYITSRRYDDFHDVASLRSRLPLELSQARLGPTEMELADFILNYSTERVLNIEGPRGSGKTSLLRYVEEVIRTSGYAKWPVMLIVDCLGESEQSVLSEAEISRLVGEELTKAVSWVPTEFHASISVAASKILESPTFNVVRTQFVLICQQLGDAFARLVLVFDNLDQHTPSTVIRCMELTKQLHVTTQLASLITLRPGCLQGVQSRGGARAYFRFRTNVSAPQTRAWLEQIGHRVAAGATEEFKDKGKYRTVDSNELDHPTIVKIFQRLGRLLVTAPRGQDSAVGILDSVAADDVRHLVLLVRHLLSHKELPVDWLLSDLVPTPDYYPIEAVLEGDRFLYDGRSFVPNLLCLDVSDGSHDLLASFRTLTLLNSGVHAVASKHLVRQLQILGHNTRTIVEGIKALHDALLIRSTSAEQIFPDAPLPDAFFITEAGEYYLHRLVGYIDYLVTVIPNVPLAHESLKLNLGRRRLYSYLDRLSALRELIEKVKEQEAAQISRLQERGKAEDVAAIADALENEGLLCDALLEGLMSARARGEYSRSEAVQRESQELDSVIAVMQGWLTEQKQKLRVIAERSRDLRVPEIADVVLRDLDTQVSVRRTHGRVHSQLQTSVEVRTLAKIRFALVALTGQRGNMPFSTAAWAVRKKGATNVLLAEIPASDSGAEIEVTELKAQAIVGGLEGLGRIGLLTTSDSGGDDIKLRLQLLKSDKAGIERREIGRTVRLSELELAVQDVKDKVEASTQDADTFQDVFREQGVRLARLFMDDQGENTLASYRHLIDTLVIFVSKQAMSVPWEWIRPAPSRYESNPASLGECFHVIRWPGERMEDVIDAMAQLSVIGHQEAVGTLVTVGLNHDVEKSWRMKSPKRVPDLFVLGESCATLHLVGHVPDGDQALHILEGGPRLSEDSIRAFRLQARQVIMSGCEAAATKEATNLAIELSLASGCAVWAPIVRVRRSDVEVFDKGLAAIAGEQSNLSLSDHFKDKRTSGDCLSQLYTRYGISKGG